MDYRPITLKRFGGLWHCEIRSVASPNVNLAYGCGEDEATAMRKCADDLSDFHRKLDAHFAAEATPARPSDGVVWPR